MIVITGAAGFIASAVAARLNQEGFKDLVLVDDYTTRLDKQANYATKTYKQLLQREQLHDWLAANQRQVQFVIHLGARTDTSEQDVHLFERLNVEYSKMIFRHCTTYQIPLVYASSAATYGRGEQGFSDDHAGIAQLDPQNPYGRSKHSFDQWVLQQSEAPFFWAGLKFFNVYGPNEYHKGRMASVIYHAYHQIQQTGQLKLFRSHRPDYADGEQRRDFVYVMDVCNIILYLMQNRRHSGIYNLGSGQARTFKDLALSTFAAMGRSPEISYIDIPLDIRDSYQYYTQADMHKLYAAGYAYPMTSLESGVQAYVQEYLLPGRWY